MVSNTNRRPSGEIAPALLSSCRISAGRIRSNRTGVWVVGARDDNRSAVETSAVATPTTAMTHGIQRVRLGGTAPTGGAAA
jgi:hypothetical protein